MARRNSQMYNFISDALIGNKYPGILYWIDRNVGIFGLKCLCKSNRNWKPSDSKIFDDYHGLKTRKSNDKRQRFLVAMKHCPFIEPLEDISSKEEKYYKFRAHGTSSVNATDEIVAISALSQQVAMREMPAAVIAQNGPPMVDATDGIAASSASSQDVEMQEISAVWTAENGPPTGDASMEDNFCDLQFGNDVGYLSSMLTDSNSSHQETPDDIEQLLQSLNVAAVPDGTANDQESPIIGSSTSLYDSTDLMNSSLSCCQNLDLSDPFNLPEEEVSFPFEEILENGYVPPDYDPVKDFVESMGTPKAATAVNSLTVPEADGTQLENVRMMPGTERESSNCQSSVTVFKLDDNDGIVRSLRGDNVEKKFYMMVLNTKCM